MGLNEEIKEIFDEDIQDDITRSSLSIEALFVNQGTKRAIRETSLVAWDDTTSANCIYLKFFDGKIQKINQTDKTILTATSGVWADRATLEYTEGGE